MSSGVSAGGRTEPNAAWVARDAADRVVSMIANATEHAVDLDELVFHPWTVQGPRDVRTFVGGSGSYVIDADGRRYLDFSSQLVFTNLGHQHPRIVAAIKQQADQL